MTNSNTLILISKWWQWSFTFTHMTVIACLLCLNWSAAQVTASTQPGSLQPDVLRVRRAQEVIEAQRLEQDKAIERELSGGQSHSYRLRPPPASMPAWWCCKKGLMWWRNCSTPTEGSLQKWTARRGIPASA